MYSVGFLIKKKTKKRKNYLMEKDHDEGDERKHSMFMCLYIISIINIRRMPF